MDGYEVSAARYLAKPLNPDMLKEALLSAFAEHQKRNPAFREMKNRFMDWLTD